MSMLYDLSYPRLRCELSSRGLSVAGCKNDLIDRLYDALVMEGIEDPETTVVFAEMEKEEMKKLLLSCRTQVYTDIRTHAAPCQTEIRQDEEIILQQPRQQEERQTTAVKRDEVDRCSERWTSRLEEVCGEVHTFSVDVDSVGVEVYEVKRTAEVNNQVIEQRFKLPCEGVEQQVRCVQQEFTTNAEHLACPYAAGELLATLTVDVFMDAARDEQLSEAIRLSETTNMREVLVFDLAYYAARSTSKTPAQVRHLAITVEGTSGWELRASATAAADVYHARLPKYWGHTPLFEDEQ